MSTAGDRTSHQAPAPDSNYALAQPRQMRGKAGNLLDCCLWAKPRAGVVWMPSHESTSFFTVEQAKAPDEGSNSPLSGGASGRSCQLGGIILSSQADAVPEFGVCGGHIPSVPQLHPAWESVQASRAARGQSLSSGVQANSWGPFSPCMAPFLTLGQLHSSGTGHPGAKGSPAGFRLAWN